MSSISQFQLEQMQARLALNRHEAVPPPELEKDLHAEIMLYCDRQWPRWLYIHARTDKRTTNAPGVPDLPIFLPGGRVLLIEVKRPGQKVSPTQLAWHAEAAKLGHEVHIVHSMDEFKLCLLKTFHQQDHP